jgi:hypothetical protein
LPEEVEVDLGLEHRDLELLVVEMEVLRQEEQQMVQVTQAEAVEEMIHLLIIILVVVE